MIYSKNAAVISCRLVQMFKTCWNDMDSKAEVLSRQGLLAMRPAVRSFEYLS